MVAMLGGIQWKKPSPDDRRLMRVSLRVMAKFVGSAALFAACASTPIPPPTDAPTASPAASPLVTPLISPAASVSPSATPSQANVEVTQADFPLTGGCGDVFMYAATADGRLAVVIQWEGAATAAWEEDGVAASASLPDDSVAVSLEAGQGLSSLYCNDILMPGQGVQATTEAVAGSAEISVRPQLGGFEPAATADATLLDIVFEVSTGDEVEIWHLDRLELRDISVGWFAG